MDTQKVDLFLLKNNGFLPKDRMPFIRERLLALDEEKWSIVSAMSFKDPNIALMLSLLFLVGFAGIDRLYIDDIAIGVAKLITGGACGIWSIIDLFLISEATKKKNYEQLEYYLLS